MWKELTSVATLRVKDLPTNRSVCNWGRWFRDLGHSAKNIMGCASHVVYTGHLPLSCVVASIP